MARPPTSPGPPPPNFRPRGAPAPPRQPLLGRPSGSHGAAGSGSTGAGPGAVTAVAVITLLVGLVMGFFLGRATEEDERSSAPPLTSPSSSTSRPPGDTIPQNAPVDPNAPPSTDLDPTMIGTLEDPIPAGQPYVLGHYEIEVRSVDRDADDTLEDFDSVNPIAPQGRQHLLVEVAVRYTDRDGLGNPSAIPFFVSDGSTRWSDVEAQCGLVPDSIMDATPIAHGEETVGNACFTVPVEAASDVLLGTEGVNGALYFELPE